MFSLRCQDRSSAVILFSDACCYHTTKTLQSKCFVSSCRCGTQLDTRQHFREESRIHTSWNHEHLFSFKEMIPLHWAMLFWPRRTKGVTCDIQCMNYTTCMWIQGTCHVFQCQIPDKGFHVEDEYFTDWIPKGAHFQCTNAEQAQYNLSEGTQHFTGFKRESLKKAKLIFLNSQLWLPFATDFTHFCAALSHLGGKEWQSRDAVTSR